MHVGRFGLARAAAFALAAVASPAQADNILITNDDGLTSNVKALYAELKARGHDVIVSVPCTGQSGMGAAIRFMRPLGPLTEPCLNAAASPGDPGAGPMTRAGFERDWFYVYGTPVMALLYGIDVQAKARWGKAPDLVLSGPNEGQNVGSIVISSGTVSNAQYAAIRGIPAIALSAGDATKDNASLANPASAIVARRSADIVDWVKGRVGGGAIMPRGTALNVNFPDDPARGKLRFSRIGSFNAYDVRFAANMATDAGGDVLGAGQLPPLPGIVIALPKRTPSPAQADDESVVYKTDVAISIMQIGYDADAKRQRWLKQQLRR